MKWEGKAIPAVLVGPLIRKLTENELVLWLVTSIEVVMTFRLITPDKTIDRSLIQEVEAVQIGARAYLQLVRIPFDEPVPKDKVIGYDLGVVEKGNKEGERWIRDWAPHLCRTNASNPDFVVKSRLDRIFHGSCRKPHHAARDGLVRVDSELISSSSDAKQRPAVLMLTGDQVYTDDVAGPMLQAIHQLIDVLGLFEERIPDEHVVDSKALRDNPYSYYQRHRLLPANQNNIAMLERFFGGTKKPIFTSANAQNHLISLAEMMAMYLLVWSPVCWPLLKQTVLNQKTPLVLSEKDAVRFRNEQRHIDEFVSGLPKVARALAHIPTYMIFDDHDVTDDWNLSVLWESAVYQHPFSRRIVGNALIGYLLCQGWGNQPLAFGDLVQMAKRLMQSANYEGFLSSDDQDGLIDALLSFSQWHYRLPTDPPLLVMDTRTHRWRSEIAQSQPSGLMDWEALSEFQQSIMGEHSVVVVSPAPVFGVKLIESIQRVFTWFGQPLMVDAENWMAHQGSASVLLNIFGHKGTPEHFIILSGDVHYSFAYDVRIRHSKSSPHIFQITSSGIKNEFPSFLLEILDRLNRWLYAPYSPLNWFTKRRRMRIDPRLPEGGEAGERLWNQSGIGLIEIDEQGVLTNIRQLNADKGGTRFVNQKPVSSNVYPNQIETSKYNG